MNPGHGIIGCGRVAPNHVDGFRSLGNWELLWACDRQQDLAAEFAARFGIDGVAGSASTVLADPRVTSVSIAVDHEQHAALATAALTAGKHVLLEKPLALCVPDAEALVALANNRGLVLSVVSQHRYDPLVREVRRWLHEGLLGELVYVQVTLEAQREPSYYTQSYWRGTWAGEGGSAVANQGYHCLDVTRFLCGELVVKAAVVGRSQLGRVIETEDTLSALLVAGETPVTLNVTVASSTTWRSRLEFVGSQGSVCFDLDHPGTLRRAEGNRELEDRAAAARCEIRSEPAPGIDYYGISHRAQIADFARAATGHGDLDEGPEVAVGMVSLLTDLYQASGARPVLGQHIDT